jgi:hypothetical protein
VPVSAGTSFTKEKDCVRLMKAILSGGALHVKQFQSAVEPDNGAVRRVCGHIPVETIC